MDCGSDTPGISNAIWVRDLLGQTDRVAASLEGLIGIASSQRSPGGKDRGSHRGVLPPIRKSQRAMLLRVIQGETPFQVLAGGGEIALEKKCQPQRIVSLQWQSSILRT